MQPTVLVYQMEAPRLKQLRDAAKQMQIQVKTVQKKDYLQPVGKMAGLELPSGQPYAGEDLPAEMLVLCGLSDSLTERMLYALRKMGTVNYKAVLTQTNQHWSGISLFLALSEEHAQLQSTIEKRPTETI